MSITKIDAATFLTLSVGIPVFDVRSPSEYTHAHLPSALSLPLFSDQERKIIGTAYKQESRVKAIRFGLEYFGPKLLPLVDQVLAHFEAEKITHKQVVVHCWRGGMRSAAVAWLLDLYGFEVLLIKGGYKAVRKLLLQQFERKYNITIIGGYTGSNKTGLITTLRKKGKPAIDLEGIAAHKGSAFGNLDQLPQPSQEMFENILAIELYKFKDEAGIWLEGESQRIGHVNIPPGLFEQMRSAKLIFVDITFEERLKHIIEGYGKASKDKLMSATLRLQKRLGGLETKNAINALLEDDINLCFTILLKYYDRWYLRSTYDKQETKREIVRLECATTNETTIYDTLMQHVIRSTD